MATAKDVAAKEEGKDFLGTVVNQTSKGGLCQRVHNGA
jgi:hypothetical protein